MKLIDFLETVGEDGEIFSLKTLFNDKEDMDVKRGTSKIIWEKMQDYPEPIHFEDRNDAYTYFSIMAQTADFEYTHAEIEEVAGTLTSALDFRQDDYPLDAPWHVADVIMDSKKLNAKDRIAYLHNAARTFFLLTSVFPEHLEVRHKRRGAPAMPFYQRFCQQAYHEAKLEQMAEKVPIWTPHVRDNVIPDNYIMLPN